MAVRSVSWDDAKKRRRLLLVALVAFVLFLPMPSASPPGPALTNVIVQSLPGRIDDARRTIAEAGGSVDPALPPAGGAPPSLPATALRPLRRTGAGRGVPPPPARGVETIE